MNAFIFSKGNLLIVKGFEEIHELFTPWSSSSPYDPSAVQLKRLMRQRRTV